MNKELQLYVHIPFCVKKCAYCDFLSFTAHGGAHKRYTEALIKEIQERARALRGYNITTVFVGGGTPSILPSGQMTYILNELHRNFTIEAGAEITLEANPGTVTANKLAAWKEAGANRLSIGLQSADDRELALLGRIHTWQDFLDTYGLARHEGFTNINVDLISAIPGQNAHSWKKSLEAVTGLEPEHISAYSLILEEGTPFYEKYRERGEEGIPGEEEEAAIDEVTRQVLEGGGYVRYEISNYAKEGYACRHNLGYWERKEYLGLGLGASSFIDRTRFKNTPDLARYLGETCNGGSLVRDIEQLSRSGEMEEFMFLGLRKLGGISKNAFRANFGQDLEDIYGPILEKLCRKGLLCVSGDVIRLTGRGIDLSNVVFVEFLQPPL